MASEYLRGYRVIHFVIGLSAYPLQRFGRPLMDFILNKENFPPNLSLQLHAAKKRSKFWRGKEN